MTKALYAALAALLGILAFSGCGGNSASLSSEPARGQANPSESPALEWPTQLPAGGLQPWQATDDNGMVIPSGNSRSSNALDLNSEFVAGVDRFLESASGVADNGEATTLTSGAGSLSYAIYQIGLGDQPGVIDVDANMTAGDGYYVGLSNYDTGTWEWHGPFSDHNPRLFTGEQVDAGANYMDGVGNVYVNVLAYDGTSVDVVGAAANPYSPGAAPDAPVGLALTAASGSLYVEWSPVLPTPAGYRIYYSSASFADAGAAGVKVVDTLEGLTHHVLDGLSGETFVRISAVDTAGNESALSDIASATPLSGSGGALQVTVSAPSAQLNDVLAVTATGADSYDFDLDGDGSPDVLGDATGSATVDTSATGIIRVGVVGTSGGGTTYADGGISVIVSSNERPLASAFADVYTGPAPLIVQFDGSESYDPDGTIAGGGWDFDGNGIYGDEPDPKYDAASDMYVTSPVVRTFTTPGVYNVKLKVIDDTDDSDVDTLTIVVSGEDYSKPHAAISASTTECYPGETLTLDASESRASFGDTIASYDWELTGDGMFDDDSTTPPDSSNDTRFATPGEYEVGVQITDTTSGQMDSAQIKITVHGWSVLAVDDPAGSDEAGQYTSLCVVNGDPAISYQYYDSGAGTHNLRYVRSSTADGGNVADWTNKVTVATTGTDITYTSLAVVAGNPAIAFRDNGDEDLYYVRALTSTGDSASDWDTDVPIHTANNVGEYPSLCVVNGSPAISYYDATAANLRYAYSTDPTGAAGTWTHLLVDDGGGGPSYDAGAFTSLQVVNNHPAISYFDATNNELDYALSSTAGGEDSGDWNPIVVNSGPYGGGYFSSLCIVDAHPAIACSRLESGYWRLCYIRSTTTDGASSSDWPVPLLEFDSSNDELAFSSLAVIGGTPCIAYYESGGGQLYFAKSNTATGTNGDDWDVEQVAGFDDDAGAYCSLAEVDGKPAICWRNGSFGYLVYGIRY